MRKTLRIALMVVVAGLAGLAGWIGWTQLAGPRFSQAEKALIASLSLDALPPAKPDPSNRVAADPRAIEFGRTLFFDPSLSANGEVACATCHFPEAQFQDNRPRGRGIGETPRRSMPLVGAAWSPWQFWDGRKDSLWSQALGPLEDAREHGMTRTGLAHALARAHADAYREVFGPLPDLSGLPEAAGPLGNGDERRAWEAMDAADRETVDRVFADMGKAIAAFVATIEPAETRFDRFARALAAGREPEGEAAFSDAEREGLKLFIGRGDCINCHNGPRLTDDHFHNTGVPVAPDVPDDRGRATATALVASDPFNCLGPHSDAGPEDCGDLRFMVTESHEHERAFKTPTLRGAASRPPYMHSGQIGTLEEVVDHYSRAPAAPSGHSELERKDFTDRERAALIAFLRTLDGG